MCNFTEKMPRFVFWWQRCNKSEQVLHWRQANQATPSLPSNFPGGFFTQATWTRASLPHALEKICLAHFCCFSCCCTNADVYVASAMSRITQKSLCFSYNARKIKQHVIHSNYDQNMFYRKSAHEFFFKVLVLHSRRSFNQYTLPPLTFLQLSSFGRSWQTSPHFACSNSHSSGVILLKTFLLDAFAGKLIYTCACTAIPHAVRQWERRRWWRRPDA